MVLRGCPEARGWLVGYDTDEIGAIKDGTGVHVCTAFALGQRQDWRSARTWQRKRGRVTPWLLYEIRVGPLFQP
jgi:hypothetical protein